MAVRALMSWLALFIDSTACSRELACSWEVACRGLASSPITAMSQFSVGVCTIGFCHDDKQMMCMANVVYGDVLERIICRSRP